MQQFTDFLVLVGTSLPDLLSFLLCPALLLVAGVTLAVFHKEKPYLPIAVGLGAVGFFLVLCESGPAVSRVSLCYLALYVLLAVLVRLLFLIPFRREHSDAEELYERFALPLEEPTEAPAEEPSCGEEECGVRLDHAASLIERLQKSRLSASDRLEVDSLSRTLEGFRSRALTADEMRAVNDCLSTILKLTAKYKL